MSTQANTAQQQTMTPDQAMAQAQQAFEAGRLPQCENICRRIIEAVPGYAPAWFQLGMIAVRSDKMPLAADLMAEAVRCAPQEGAYRRSLCEVYRRLGRLKEAVAEGRGAVILMPQDTDAHYNCALALADAGDAAGAAAEYRAALACDPAHGLSANNLGTVLEKLGQEDEALKAYAQAAAINPRHAEAQNNLGAIYSARGELDRARACFEAAIVADPGFVHAHYNLSTLKKYTPDDPHLAALEAVARQAQALPEGARLRFCFAIGKAFEDVGRFDESFRAYAEGNALKRKTFHYDERRTADNIGALIAGYDRAFAAAPAQGCADETPVFIVGMPRSGTTLIEQILATHSKVFGAGELQDLSDCVRESTGQPSENVYLDWLKSSPPEKLAELGEAYIRRLRKLDAKAPRITDKMPGNYYYAGLISKVFPKAKIIHAMRDPLDTCLSNYARLFNETMVFAYDLGELGRYYANYRRLMNHWREVLPAGSILDVHYEELVADQEGQSRRMLDFLGLDWEDGCLAFHKNGRPVKTASVAQVREPMYKTSVARWKRFEKHLEPLRAAIGPEEEKT
jgi:tetratricopeptide (TPR) repeat protein